MNPNALFGGTPSLAPRIFTPDEFQSVVADLKAGRDHAILWQGDSTGDETTEMPYRLGALIGAEGPSARGQYKLFSDATQKFGAWSVIQAGDNGERYVQFDGLTRSRIIPNSAIGGITGDLDIAVKVAPNDWTPASQQVLVAQRVNAGQRAFYFYIDTTGKLALAFSSDGTAESFIASTVATGLTDGSTKWVRVTLDVDNGASGYTVGFYTGDDGVSWTQLGTGVTVGGATSIKNSTDQWEIGARGTSSNLFSGKIYEVVARQGIDGPVMNPQPITAWQASNASEGNTDGGSPTLYILNACVASTRLSYHTYDTATFQLEVPPYEPGLLILNDGLNEGVTTTTGGAKNAALAGSGKGWFTALDSWLTLAKARLPVASFAVVTQNPKISPAAAADIKVQAQRMSQLRTWAQRNSVGVLDTFKAFSDDPRTNLGFINTSDGVHPDTVVVDGITGREFEAQAVFKKFVGR